MVTFEKFISDVQLAPKYLYWISHSKNTRYNKLYLPKKGGGRRTVYNPDAHVRRVQWAILKRVLSQLELPEYVWAFEAGKSVPEMASLHVLKKHVISLDISAYFESIHQSRVKEVLMEYYDEKTSTLISELATYKYFLPQGGLLSPKLANLTAAHTFGPKVAALVAEAGGVFSLYADDITISYDRLLSQEELKSTISKITSILSEFGLRVNRKKTKSMPYYRRQYVCGAVVNAKTTLPIEVRQRLRAIIHNTGKNGVVEEAKKYGVEPEEFISSIRGQLGWYKQLHPVFGKRAMEAWKQVIDKWAEAGAHRWEEYSEVDTASHWRDLEEEVGVEDVSPPF